MEDFWQFLQVTFYHVYFADVDGIAQWSQYSWTLDAPATSTEMLKIDTWLRQGQGLYKGDRRRKTIGKPWENGDFMDSYWENYRKNHTLQLQTASETVLGVVFWGLNIFSEGTWSARGGLYYCGWKKSCNLDD